MKNTSTDSRRSFLKNSLLATSGIFIVPRHVLGRGYVAPSDKLNIAAVGCGGKADFNIQQAYANGADNIVALCDVDDRQAVKYRKKFDKSPYYQDYRKMLDEQHANIDAVIISTPDHMHYPIAKAAIDMGKHVYVEKPLTKDIWEARSLAEAAKKQGVVTQMGNQGSSGKGTRITEALIQSGIIGEIHTVEVWTNRPVWPQGVQSPKDKKESQPTPAEVNWDLWLGTAPLRDYHEAYMPTRWRGYWDFGTGSLGDMGCHFIDVPFRALKLGYPTSVYCSVGQVYSDFFKEAYYDDVCPPSSAVHLKFNNPNAEKYSHINFSWYDGGIRPKLPEGCPFEKVFADPNGGMLFIGTKGVISAELFGYRAKLFQNGKQVEFDEPKNIRPLVEGDTNGHQQQWVKACKAGYGTYTSSNFEEAGPLTEIVLMGNLAVRSYLHREPRKNGGHSFTGRKELIWDGENMKITNFDIANNFVKREYRTGW